MQKLIYLDHAATTPMHPEVWKSMEPYALTYYGNPSAMYSFAAKSKRAVETARHQAAQLLHAKDNEIYFTAGGSESDNWAIKGAAFARREQGRHIITTKIEHHAVLHTCEYLEKRGFHVTYLDVDEDGIVNAEAVRNAIRPDTVLISVMFANNEIGTIQPIREIGTIAREHGILFHTDAVQAYGHLPIDVNELSIDMLSASGHKMNGPKGVGILYLKNNVNIGSFIHGGAQERSRRAGTHNVPGIAGFGKAAELAAGTMEERAECETALRDYLIEKMLSEVPYTSLNGHLTNRLPNNANFSFRFVEGESLLIMLDQRGICASSGSACTSASIDPSHVLLATGLSEEMARGSLRLTLSEQTTREEIDFVVDSVREIVERLRGLSVLYEDFLRRQGE